MVASLLRLATVGALLCLGLRTAPSAAAGGIGPGGTPSAAIAEAHPVYNWTVVMKDVHLHVSPPSYVP